MSRQPPRIPSVSAPAQGAASGAAVGTAVLALYKDFRAAVLTQDDEKARTIIQTILKLQPEDDDAQQELLRLESKLLLQNRIHQLRDAVNKGDTERIAELTEAIQGRPSAAPPAGTLAACSPRPARTALRDKKTRLSLSFTLVTLLLMGAVSFIFSFMFWQHSAAENDRKAVQQEIDEVWRQQHISGLKQTKTWLEKTPSIEDARAFLLSHETFFKEMHKGLKNPAAPMPVQPDSTQDEIQTLLKSLQEWQSLHTKETLPQPAETSGSFAVSESNLLKYQQWLSRRESCWNVLKNDLQLEKSPPSPDADILEQLAAAAKDALKNRLAETDTPDDWQRLFNDLNKKDPEVALWLDQWRKMESDKSGKAAVAAVTNPDLPSWLREEAKKIKEKAGKAELAQRMAEQKQKAEEEDRTKKAQLTNIEDADALTAKNPLIICLLKAGDDPVARLKNVLKPYVAADMQIYYGQPWEKHPIPDATNPSPGGLQKWTVRNGVYRETLMSKEKLEITPAGEIIELPPGAAANGARIVARSKDGVEVLFDLRLLSSGHAPTKPVLTEAIIPATAGNGTAVITLKEDYLARLSFVGAAKPQYLLRSGGVIGGSAPQTIYELVEYKSSFVVKPLRVHALTNTPAAQLPRMCSELEAGIKSDEMNLDYLEKSKEPEKIKWEKRKIYQEVIVKKKAQLREVQVKLAELQDYVPPSFTLKSGDYTLLEKESGNTEVCRLRVTFINSPVKP